MYPFCFLVARRGDGGCTLSAEAGGVGAQGLSRAQGLRAQLMHKFNNKIYVYFLQIPAKHAIL
jgi:hypothetical protein